MPEVQRRQAQKILWKQKINLPKSPFCTCLRWEIEFHKVHSCEKYVGYGYKIIHTSLIFYVAKGTVVWRFLKCRKLFSMIPKSASARDPFWNSFPNRTYHFESFIIVFGRSYGVIAIFLSGKCIFLFRRQVALSSRSCKNHEKKIKETWH